MIQVIVHLRGGEHHRDSDSLACQHHHVSMKAARKCAKDAALGILACGARKTVAIYDDGVCVEHWVEAGRPLKVDGNVVSWRSEVACVLPSDPGWRPVPIAWYVHPVKS